MNVEEDSMFDITAINQPFGTFATAKNAGRPVSVEYVKGGINKRETFDTYEAAEKWAKQQGLKKVRDPENDGEYRITQDA